jgi:dephospho-CoA kinase
MIKIGITGSISSGKTTASMFLSNKRGPVFNADKIVQKLYRKKNFKKLLANKFNLPLSSKFKEKLKDKVVSKKSNLNKLSKIIHPKVRKEMFIFLKKNKNKKLLFVEVPLLIENKLAKYFDKIIFIKSSKSLRLRRYKKKGGNKKLFELLDSKQIKDVKKMIFCDYVVVNNASLFVLKKKLLNIIKNYE